MRRLAAIARCRALIARPRPPSVLLGRLASPPLLLMRRNGTTTGQAASAAVDSSATSSPFPEGPQRIIVQPKPKLVTISFTDSLGRTRFARFSAFPGETIGDMVFHATAHWGVAADEYCLIDPVDGQEHPADRLIAQIRSNAVVDDDTPIVRLDLVKRGAAVPVKRAAPAASSVSVTTPSPSSSCSLASSYSAAPSSSSSAASSAAAVTPAPSVSAPDLFASPEQQQQPAEMTTAESRAAEQAEEEGAEEEEEVDLLDDAAEEQQQAAAAAQRTVLDSRGGIKEDPAVTRGRQRLMLALKYVMRDPSFKRRVRDEEKAEVQAHELRKLVKPFARQYAKYLAQWLPGYVNLSREGDKEGFLPFATVEDPTSAPAPPLFEMLKDGPHGPFNMLEATRLVVPEFIKFVEYVRMQGRGVKGRSIKLDADLEMLANMKMPHEWFPHARSIQRRIIMHVGPTNSGKTHHALTRLKEAASGVYCGPLRLLAWEVYEKMLAAGVPCDLLTGQEHVKTPGARHVSCTVEMVNTERFVDVAVIDEMQMIGSADRGHAWTRALLGIPARELHLCGDPTMVKIVQEICATTGEHFEVREYKRLSPLKLGKPLGSLREIKKGDCVVAFSRVQLYQLKAEIERETGLKCCIVYGSLPPEVRKQQAELFNSPDSGYDVLVASDAVGMGLNLNIRRIVFATTEKFDGDRTRGLLTTEALQIGGRAGRFNSQFPTGFVTCLDPDEFPYLRHVLKQPMHPLAKAGLAPTPEQIEQLARERPGHTLNALFDFFTEYAQLDDLYFMCDTSEWKEIATHLEDISLSIRDRFTFCLAPASTRLPAVINALREFARCYSVAGKVALREEAEIVEREEPQEEVLIPAGATGVVGQAPSEPSAPRRIEVRDPSCVVHIPIPPLEIDGRVSHPYIQQLESAYQSFDVYVWLSRRFGADVFIDRDYANEQRKILAEAIEQALQELSRHSTASFFRHRRRLDEDSEWEGEFDDDSEEERGSRRRRGRRRDWEDDSNGTSVSWRTGNGKEQKRGKKPAGGTGRKAQTLRGFDFF